jgi:hypothetical protein
VLAFFISLPIYFVGPYPCVLDTLNPRMFLVEAR